MPRRKKAVEPVAPVQAAVDVPAAEPVAPYIAVANRLTISNTVSFNWTTVWEAAHSLADLRAAD